MYNIVYIKYQILDELPLIYIDYKESNSKLEDIKEQLTPFIIKELVKNSLRIRQTQIKISEQDLIWSEDTEIFNSLEQIVNKINDFRLKRFVNGCKYIPNYKLEII